MHDRSGLSRFGDVAHASWRFQRGRASPAAKPVDAGCDRAPRLVLRTLLVAAAVAALFGSRPLVAWTERQPDTETMALVRDSALRWDAAMTGAHLAGAYGALRASMRELQAQRFPFQGERRD